MVVGRGMWPASLRWQLAAVHPGRFASHLRCAKPCECRCESLQGLAGVRNACTRVGCLLWQDRQPPLAGPTSVRPLIAALASEPCPQRVDNGRRYYDFEFTAKSRGYTRHALASVTVGNGEGPAGLGYALALDHACKKECLHKGRSRRRSRPAGPGAALVTTCAMSVGQLQTNPAPASALRASCCKLQASCRCAFCCRQVLHAADRREREAVGPHAGQDLHSGPVLQR